MSIKPTFQGEVQFRRYSDTSTQGQQIVLQVAGRAELEPFIGMEGKRFMAVLVQIGDDEQPVPPPVEKPAKEGPKRLPPALEFLVGVSRDEAFLAWLECEFPIRWAKALGKTDVERGASVVRAVCCVESRKEIDGDPNAKARFDQHIRGPWQEYARKIESTPQRRVPA
jgi:hypothetical protein